MTTVVDASVLVAALVDSGPEGQWAESVLAEGPLASPELALAEASNVLRRLERAGHISRLEAASAHATCSSSTWSCSPSHPLPSVYGSYAPT